MQLPPYQAVTELFMDIADNPDQHTYYLIGLLVREGGQTYQHSFWTDTRPDEQECWQHFRTVVAAFPDVPIYRYESYDAAAVEQLANRHQSDAELLTRRLVTLVDSLRCCDHTTHDRSWSPYVEGGIDMTMALTLGSADECRCLARSATSVS